MRQPKRAFSKHDLFEAAWGEPSCEDDNTVAVHVSNIRTKLKASGTDRYIKTVWGIGFKLNWKNKATGAAVIDRPRHSPPASNERHRLYPFFNLASGFFKAHVRIPETIPIPWEARRKT